MDNSIATLAGVIQLAVAPVFLLAGIAGFLNVMSGRLGRIVDRARIVERRVVAVSEEPHLSMTRMELRTLWRRVKLINWSIGMCTAAGLLVCSVIVGLFVGSFWGLHIAGPVVTLFVLALLVLIVALVLFLKEVQLATRVLHPGREFTD
ncbi:DUF2721 domain-containing protein [Parahaliea mediterranea]|uniref:DUF2721 domain-containing protein n=1 Tax=Parahaliea mediterranea TaxID=651086 RepID=A0A939IMA7_9GAMM|nr:DUF2721 domain-containing protein [Parahaliea mediterranea]MBN7796817.1 DUF2721 domain-containing protein [Parahaliea mediterranea]